MAVKVRSSSKGEKATCPYCKSDFLDTEKILTCGACQTSIHADCAKEALRCTTTGCEKLFEQGNTEEKDSPGIHVGIARRRERGSEPEPLSERLFGGFLTVTVLIFTMSSLHILYNHQGRPGRSEISELLSNGLFMYGFFSVLPILALTYLGRLMGFVRPKSVGWMFCLSFFTNLIALMLVLFFFSNGKGQLAPYVAYWIFASVASQILKKTMRELLT